MSTQVIAAPSAAHTTVSVVVTPGQTLHFAMDISKAVFARPELAGSVKSPDLVITLEDGSKIELKGFFVTAEDAIKLPTLQLADGTQIDGGDFLVGINPDFDLSTSVGSEVAVSQGSGLNEMAEAVSPGISGVDRLAALGTEQYSNAIAPRGVETVATVTASAFDGSPSAPGDSGAATPPDNGGSIVLPPDNGGIAPPPPDNGGGAPAGPTPPHAYTRAALLGADGDKDPAVSVSLPAAFGIANPQDISCSASDNYNVLISANGIITFSLKYPSSGPAPLENFTIVADGKSYVVQVASTSGELKDLNGIWGSVTWTDGTEGGETTAPEFVDKVWAGVTREHLLGASGSAVVAPHVEGADDGVNITAGTEIHLQMTDSSLTAGVNTAGEETSAVVLTNLNGGSFTISNENASVFSVRHTDPSRHAQDNYEYYAAHPENYEPGSFYNPNDLRTDATVVTGMGAKGPGTTSHTQGETPADAQNAVNSITVTGGDVIIKAGSGAPVIAEGDQVGFVSGTYAADGGKNEVTAENITVSASADGFAQGSPAGQAATVTGVRSDGAAIEVEKYEYTYGGHTYVQKTSSLKESSTTNLTADKDVTVTATITGDTSTQDHSHTSYAAVAATERGHVNIDAGKDVLIETANAATGDLSTAGVYGIFSGLGLGEKDLPKLEDFPNPQYLGEGYPGIEGQKYNEQAYREYMQGLQFQFAEDKLDWNTYDPETGMPGHTHNTSEVNIKAGGDVGVHINLGAGDYSGVASGVKINFGDVNIESGADISVQTSLQGTHTGDTAHKLSAVELSGGSLSMKAQGDINIGLEAGGGNLAVLNYQPYAQNYNPYGLNTTDLTAEGAVTLKGEAGKDGGSADNRITGINAGNLGFKKETFTVNAKEFAIDVTAYGNGGTTASTGIQVGGETPAGPYMSSMHHFTLAVDAPEVEISARVVENAATPSQGDSTATAITVNQGFFGVFANDPESLFAMRMYSGRLVPGLIVTSLDSLALTAEGANQNVGIAAKPVRSEGAEEWNTASASVDIRAKELNIKASGGAQPGPSASYGIMVANPAQFDYNSGYMADQGNVRLETSNLTITTQGSDKSVGIHSSGYSDGYTMFGYLPGVEVTSTRTSTTHNKGTAEEYTEVTTEPLTVIITCTITNGDEQLRGIALEAVNGGHITIRSSDGTTDPYSGQWINMGKHNDTVILKGDVHVGDLNNTYDPNDPDNYQPYKSSSVLIDTGWGNDRIEIDGDINLGWQGSLRIDAGAGSDVVALGGKISGGNLTYTDEHGETHSNGHLQILGGDGYDLLILKAPDAETFEQWYGDWFTSLTQKDLYDMSFEGIIVQGVSDPGELAWLTNAIENFNLQSDFHINLQFFGADAEGHPVNLTMVNDASAISEAFALDGSGHDNDLLYVRFDADNHDSLSGLSRALSSGHIKGVENLLVDMADGQNQELDLGVLKGLFDGKEANTNIILRADSTDTLSLQEAGWHTDGSSHTLDGISSTYTVYTNADEQQLYVQLVATVHG